MRFSAFLLKPELLLSLVQDLRIENYAQYLHEHLSTVKCLTCAKVSLTGIHLTDGRSVLAINQCLLN